MTAFNEAIAMVKQIKSHWEDVYSRKSPDQFSWYQQYPELSVKLIEMAGLEKYQPVIDIGGGDTLLADVLMEKGYSNITVSDISKLAITRAKERMADKASSVKWIIADVLELNIENSVALWHDRAVFHFLTEENQRAGYRHKLNQHLQKGGYFLLATFSEKGPETCSGLKVRRHSEEEMTEYFKAYQKIYCQTEEHRTPFNISQSFQYCLFKKMF